MVDKGRAELPSKGEHFDMPAALRLGAWGLCAGLAVGAAILAAHANLGIRGPANTPAAAAVKPPPEPMRPTAAQLLAHLNEPDAETKRLAESVRMLTLDRDRLTTRIAALERSMDDLTGSISRPPATPPQRSTPPDQPPPNAGPQRPPSQPLSLGLGPPAAPPAAPPTSRPSDAGPAPQSDDQPPPGPPLPLSPQTAAEPPPAARSGRMATIEYYARSTQEPAAQHAVADEQSPAGSTATATDFGIDLGGANSVNGLRTLWATLKGKYPQLLNNMWPVMAVRDRPKQPGTVELRLVAGPLPNAGHAARLCASFAALAITCQPTVFDGQRLALR